MALSTNDAKIILGMIGRGDDHHDIAAWFGENQGRIADVKDGKYGTLELAPADQLPPKGPPGVKGKRLRAFVQKAIEALENGDIEAGLHFLNDGLAMYNKHEA